MAWRYLENLAEIQEREVGCLVEKIVDETDGNPYPLPYFREQDLAAEDARAARISNAMTRKVAFELTRLAIPYEFRFEEEAADDERLSEIWDMLAVVIGPVPWRCRLILEKSSGCPKPLSQ